MNHDPPIVGNCLCKTVRFQIIPPTKWCSHCHCSMCREAHGAPVVTWVGVVESRFHIVAGSNRLRWYRSSPEARRGFCVECGSSLFFQSSRWAGEMHVCRASIAGAIDREPDAHVYYDHHVAWLNFEDELKKLGGETGTANLA